MSNTSMTIQKLKKVSIAAFVMAMSSQTRIFFIYVGLIIRIALPPDSTLLQPVSLSWVAIKGIKGSSYSSIQWWSSDVMNNWSGGAIPNIQTRIFVS